MDSFWNRAARHGLPQGAGRRAAVHAPDQRRGRRRRRRRMDARPRGNAGHRALWQVVGQAAGNHPLPHAAGGLLHAAGVRDLQRPGGAPLRLVREERDRQGADDRRLGRVRPEPARPAAHAGVCREHLHLAADPRRPRRGGRNGIVRYDSGDGWFCVPENNWATSLVEGQNTGDPKEKFLGLDIFQQGRGLCVATNPKAIQLTLFPREEIEWFSVNLGVFSGDMLDGRTAVAEHLRRRFKFHDPPRPLGQRLPLAAEDGTTPLAGRSSSPRLPRQASIRPLRRVVVHRGRHGRRESLDRHGLAVQGDHRAGMKPGTGSPSRARAAPRSVLVRRPWPRRRRSGEHRFQAQAN